MTPTNKFSVTSPLFPKQYPLTIDCTWTLTTSAKGNIVIDFIEMDTGQNYDKFYIASPEATIPFDVDELIEGPLVLRFTGSQAPRSVLLQGQENMKMVWDASLWSPDKQSGFAVRISWASSNSK